MGPTFKRRMARIVLGVSLTLPAAQAALAIESLQIIGKGEGTLNVVAWEGYAQDDWVKPFEAATGCMVHAKYAGSSDEMVALMRNGGAFGVATGFLFGKALTTQSFTSSPSASVCFTSVSPLRT